MRDLTIEECGVVAGGLWDPYASTEVAEIICFAPTYSPISTYIPPYDPVVTPSVGTYQMPTGGGTVSQGEIDANNFAAAHIKVTAGFDLNDPTSLALYKATHAALKNAYMKAQSDPTGLIDEPGTDSMTGAQLLAFLNHYSVELSGNWSDAFDVKNGRYISALTMADTQHPGEYVTRVYAPDYAGELAARASQLGVTTDLAINFLIFHEMAHATPHAMSYTYNQGYPNPSAVQSDNIEKYTNTQGFAIAQFLGAPMPTLAQIGQAQGGYLPQ